MPIYVDNKIEDFVAKVTRSKTSDPVFSGKKIVEAVDTVAGKEPGHTPVPQTPGNTMLVENKIFDLVRGNIVSSYS